MTKRKNAVYGRLLCGLIAVLMALMMMPARETRAAEGNVAQITRDGSTQSYATLQAAITESVSGDTIELLDDAALPTTSFPSGKTITIDGKGFTIDAGKAYLNVAGNVTFRNCTMNMYDVPNGHWMYIYMASNGSLNFEDSSLNIDGTNAADNTTAMYFPEPGDPKAGVSFTRSNVTIKNCRGNGISWGGRPNNGYNTLTITDCPVFTIDNCAEMNTAGGGGIIGTFDIVITRSTVKVTNNRSYGSNGSNYEIKDSTVTYSNNGTHGLSATDLEIYNSTVTAENNGYYGIYASGAFVIDRTSKVTVTGNSYAEDCAGLKLTSGVTNGRVEAGAVVKITDNYCSGLSNNGKVTFEEGAKLTIMNNVNDKGTTSNGGGVYNSGDSANLTLPSDAVIYNNHADTAGDDIFNNTTSTITFGKVGAGWSLDGNLGDCEHTIDGWYDDSVQTTTTDENGNPVIVGGRWEAHANADAGETNHIVEFTDFNSETGLATVTGLTQLKAAHGVIVEPTPDPDPEEPDPEEPKPDDPDPTPPSTPSLTITKKWVADNPEDRPDSVTFNVYKDGIYDGFLEIEGKYFGDSDTWRDSYPIEEYEVGADWWVEEVDVPVNYTDDVEEIRDNVFYVYNTYEEPVIEEPVSSEPESSEPSSEPSEVTPSEPSVEPSEPSSEPVSEPEPAEPTLPQTGQLWWPVILLLAGGAVLVAFGAFRTIRGHGRRER